MKTASLILLSMIIIGEVGCCAEEQNSSKPGASVPSDTLLTMPYNKILEPAGQQIVFGDTALENHALDVAVSPDGNTLAVEGRYCVVFVRMADHKILYRLDLHSSRKSNTMNTYAGICWFSDHNKQTVLWGARNRLMQAAWNGSTAEIVKTYFFAPKKGVSASLPNEMVVRKENGKAVIYVVLNGNDQVAKVALNSGDILWQKPVGLAPYGITLARGRLYVTNWSGRVPGDNTENTAGIPWEKAQVDKFGAVSSGTVSVLDPNTGKTCQEISVGLHPNEIITGLDQQFVYVSNGNSDSLSVINTRTTQVVETLSVRLNREKNPYYGDSPNGLALSADGQRLYVANGMDNALAVVALGKKICATSTLLESTILGFIPTAAYPGGIALNKDDSMLYVADIEGFGARLTSTDSNNRAYQTFIKVDGKSKSTAGAFNTHRMQAVVSAIAVPGRAQLADYTQAVVKNNRQSRLALLKLLPRPGVASVPVPQRIGEPSVFKHVVYIIKENRTYDQILGDVQKGNGDPALCTFGAEVTPNLHKIVNEFVLLDNYRASGKCSAEGHLWTDASIVTDYIEKNVRAWFRSYTHVLYDAMAYPKTGFLWDNALDHGKSVRIYGEACIPKWSTRKRWTAVYRNFLAGKPFHFTNRTTIDRIRAILSPTYPGYDSHNIPDVLRAQAFIDELKQYEAMAGDALPNLMIVALPNDHTAGTSPRHPTPRAMVADNDVALGQIIAALSHSRFWKNTVVFVTEDDSQNGWDHVSAYRTVGAVISPYCRRGTVVSRQYNQTSMIRTIEQILGLPPMNVEDATARPMFEVFTIRSDDTPYTAVKNKIPLNEMNSPVSALKGRSKRYALASEQMAQKGIDAGNDDLLNRIIWSSVKNNQSYPTRYAGKEPDHDDD